MNFPLESDEGKKVEKFGKGKKKDFIRRRNYRVRYNMKVSEAHEPDRF